MSEDIHTTGGMPDKLARVAEGLLSYNLLHQNWLRSPYASVIVDSERIIAVNEQTTLMFGYHASELVGQAIEMLLPEAVRAAHERHREGYIHEPRPRPMGVGLVLRGRHKDGQEFPVEIDLNPVPEVEGLKIIATIRRVRA